jgi:CPA2 family monovalent cation:H+ antiporter-2
MEDTAQHAELIVILSRCILLFGIAGLVVPVFNRMHISPVLGFLVCGIIIGPNALGLLSEHMGFLEKILIVDEHTVRLLGELGIMALLFMIGLELSFDKLIEMKKYIFGLGTIQIALTGVVITFIAVLFDNDISTAIVIGTGFALSSTAIIMQLLDEYNMKRVPVGRIGFSILLMQDLAIVPILVMIGIFAGAGDSDAGTSYLLFKALSLAVACVAGIYFIGKQLVQPALHKIAGTKKDEWLIAFALFVLCSIALITQQVGLSAALGAFLAGLLIADTEFCDKIETMLYPLKSILLGIFFVSIGMMVNAVEIIKNPFWLLLSVMGIFVIKALVLYPLCRSFKIGHQRSKEVSMLLCQPGEFTLMVISISLALNLLPAEDAQFFLLVAVLGMLITPFVFKYIPSIRNNIKDVKS